MYPIDTDVSESLSLYMAGLFVYLIKFTLFVYFASGLLFIFVFFFLVSLSLFCYCIFILLYVVCLAVVVVVSSTALSVFPCHLLFILLLRLGVALKLWPWCKGQVRGCSA